MMHLLFACKILLLGLSIAQVLATVQVHVSNVDYYAFLTSAHEAGYLAVPNPHVFSSLRDFGPAFCGGLFFTFTAGASLTILSSAFAWAWDRLFARDRFVLVLLLALLLLCLVSANLRGFSPLITAYLLLIPVLVFPFTLKRLPKEPRNKRHIHVVSPLLAFLVFALILLAWKPSLANKDRFLDLRDRLLLSNAMGRKVNAFYYQNSLYSTRVFNSSHQQLIRSCRLDGISDPSRRTRITDALLSRDYLPLGNTVRPDVRITLSDDHLEFYDHNRRVLRTPIGDFFRDPAGPLRQYEAKTAKHAFLLGFTLFSILFLGALLLCGCAYLPFHLLSGLFLKSTPRAIKAGVLCPLTLLSILFAFGTADPESLSDPKNLSGSLTSPHPPSRIAALKYILRNQIDVTAFPTCSSMLQSLNIPERYWLAKALGVSRAPEARTFLYQLLDDPHFNVVCMALDSLGKRGTRADIPPILGKIEISDNWYEQWYAYRALRRLGWSQKEAGDNMRIGAGVRSHALLCDQFGQ